MADDQIPKMKTFNLHERAAIFAKDVRTLLAKLPRTLAMIEDGKQLIRSSGSIGANYIEANESLGDKDLVYRFRIARKEAKENAYWLQVIEVGSGDEEKERQRLHAEAGELIKILSSIITKIESRL